MGVLFFIFRVWERGGLVVGLWGPVPAVLFESTKSHIFPYWFSS